MRTFLRSTIEGARVNGVNPAGASCITIDLHLMNAAGLLPFEAVEIRLNGSGSRLDTYAIEGTAGTGEIRANGGLASLLVEGTAVTISSYAHLHEGQILTHRPKVVLVDDANRILALQERESRTTNPA